MKTLVQYICESNNIYSRGIDNTIKSICDDLMSGVDYSKFKQVKNNTPEQFDKYNEIILIDNFKNTTYKAVTTSEYYTLLNNDLKWENLSASEQGKFDKENGDIIILDENNKPVYFINVKVSTDSNFVGTISVGSLSSFNENGIYLCISQQSKKYLVVTHKDLMTLIENNPEIISNKSERNERNGSIINFMGETRNTEDYINGKDLEGYINK